MKTLTKQKVLDLVNQRLRKARLGTITFEVPNDEIKRRDDSWHLPVLPSAQPPTMFQYYEVLAEVEQDLLEKHDLNVRLIPTVPD
jgi:hypothetical protein